MILQADRFAMHTNHTNYITKPFGNDFLPC